MNNVTDKKSSKIREHQCQSGQNVKVSNELAVVETGKGETKEIVSKSVQEGVDAPNRPSYRRVGRTKIKITSPNQSKMSGLVYCKNHRTLILTVSVLSFIVLSGFASAGVYYWVQESISTTRVPFTLPDGPKQPSTSTENEAVTDEIYYDPLDLPRDVFGGLPWMADQCILQHPNINSSCVFTEGYGVDLQCNKGVCRVAQFDLLQIENPWNLSIVKVGHLTSSHETNNIANFTPCNWNHWCVIAENKSACSFIDTGPDPRVELWDIPGKWEDGCNELSPCIHWNEKSLSVEETKFKSESLEKLKRYSSCELGRQSLCTGVNEIVPRVIFLHCDKPAFRGRYCEGLPFRITACVKCNKFLDLAQLKLNKTAKCGGLGGYTDFPNTGGCVFSCKGNENSAEMLQGGSQCDLDNNEKRNSSIGYCLIGQCYQLSKKKYHKSKCH